MTGTPLEALPRRTASARSYVRRSTLLRTVPARGLDLETGPDDTVFTRFPFTLVYRLRGDEVEILAVAHARRRPGYWRSRF
jgi:toxin ParE1/3/4